jgi:phosphatidylserine/phosphatidylglycerophosphate/cardiolipin synthase-like enzyme
MSRLEVFFNRPSQMLDLSRLLVDMRAARGKIALVSAWLTDSEVVRAFIESPAEIKVAILNDGDEKLRTREAFHELGAYFTKHGPPSSWGDPDHEFHNVGGICFLGGVETDCFHEDIGPLHQMHHKFILCDESIVWTGSFNFTFQARSNYETLLRIEDRETAAAFWTEVKVLCSEWENPPVEMKPHGRS